MIDEDQRAERRYGHRRDVGTHQGGTQDHVRRAEQLEHHAGTTVPGLRHVSQFDLVGIHHRDLGTREEALEQQKNDNQQEFKIPVHQLSPDRGSSSDRASGASPDSTACSLASSSGRVAGSAGSEAEEDNRVTWSWLILRPVRCLTTKR